MNNILRAISATSIHAPVDALNTAAATSGWVATDGFEGLILVICHAGVLDAGTLDWTFQDATDGSGTAAAAITPVDGALTQVTTSNDDPNIQIARFDARASRGFMQAIGTIVTGGAFVSVCFVGVSKYGAS